MEILLLFFFFTKNAQIIDREPLLSCEFALRAPIEAKMK